MSLLWIVRLSGKFLGPGSGFCHEVAISLFCISLLTAKFLVGGLDFATQWQYACSGFCHSVANSLAGGLYLATHWQYTCLGFCNSLTNSLRVHASINNLTLHKCATTLFVPFGSWVIIHLLRNISKITVYLWLKKLLKFWISTVGKRLPEFFYNFIWTLRKT